MTNERLTMKTCVGMTKWILAGLLIAGSRGLTADSTSGGATSAAAKLGPCTITVLDTYFWRDWMPIVDRPGPDHGSPLRAKIKLRIDNSAAGATKLSVRAVVLDDQGQFHPITFNPLPNYRILPEAVAKTYRDLDEKTRAETDAKYNVIWDGLLRPGESREVELLAGDGPYLPVGSDVRVAMTWTDQTGNSVAVTTPKTPIQRTD
jgi:hypothetical protein